MKIAFHGAARTVTGSKHLITLNNGKKYLLDCGMFQGMGQQTDALNRTFGFDPASVTTMILSHAHVDHCGLIPKLVKDGFNGKIYCTPATKELTAVMLEDSAGIQENEVVVGQLDRFQQVVELEEKVAMFEQRDSMTRRSRNWRVRPDMKWFDDTNTARGGDAGRHQPAVVSRGH